MINAELSHVTTLQEFYNDIVRQQTEAHGADYCDHHPSIVRYMEECDSYTELGTHQGATAACVMLTNPSSVTLVDIDTSRYQKFLGPIAEQYCKDNNITITVKQVDSRTLAATAKTDMLFIDSYHHPAHMNAELMVHQVNVRKYIIAHDTSIINSSPHDALYQVLARFCKTYPFEIIERSSVNVGYTILRRTN